MKCEDCKFYERQDYDRETDMNVGDCRKNPPVFIGPSEEGSWPRNEFRFPCVWERDWCGEFQPTRRKPVDDACLDTNVYGSDLSVRAQNALLCNGLETVRQVKAKSSRELLSLPNLGKVSLKEIEDWITSLGCQDDR